MPPPMEDQLGKIQGEALTALAGVHDEEALRAWHAAHLAKKSPLMTALGDLGKLPKEQRAEIGKRGNKVKCALEAAYAEKEQALQVKSLARALKENAVDVTLPGCQPVYGHLHPITQTMRQMCAIFSRMGFQVYVGPEVELEEFNFTLLNLPPHHPARDMHDTFWVDDGVVLRTHTSPNQVRVMREGQPPFRVIVPGKCYRVDFDPSHNWMFHQVEGFAVGTDITLSDLKGTIVMLLRQMFGAERQVRIRSSYFPFTEPSIEADLQCTVCDGAGCGLCKYTGWLEVVPGGMIHPQVLLNCGIDPGRFRGFAFGAGLDRLAALKFGIHDVRYLYENDARFLQQF
jgi:phenylalanyl-tRNA synthetase alpha chain